MDVQMPSGLIIPSSLKYSLYRMIQDAAISTNVLRLIPLNLQTVKSAGLISVRLPLATCSLPSFSMSFNNYISTYPTYSNAGYTGFGFEAAGVNGQTAHSFPQGLESLIQRLEIVVAGVSLMTLPNYNSLFQVLKDVNQTLDHKVSRNIVEGENDVAINAVLGATYGTTQVPITAYNWSISTSGVTMTVSATATVSGDLPLNAISWNAPPASFFGYAASVVGSAYPTVTANPRPFNVSDSGSYSAFNSYLITLVYIAGTSGTWSQVTSGATGGTVNSGTVYSGFPFSFLAVPSGATPNSVFSTNTQSNTIRDFLGFFKAMPKAIQLAALGEVEIRIYLEQPQNVIVSMAPPQTLGQMYNTSGTTAAAIQTTTADYTLTNIEFQIRTMSWDNGWLDSQMQAQLADGNTLEIPYPNYYSVVQGNQNGGQTTTRFSVNTQNLRQVWGINKPNLGFTNAQYGQQVYVQSGLGPKFNGTIGPVHKGVFFADTASFPSLWGTLSFDFNSLTQSSLASVSSIPNKWQYLINNQLIPNLQVPPQRTYAFIQEMLDKEDWEEGTAINSPSTFYTGSYAMGITLEYLDKYCDNSIRELFGLDTRSASSVFYLNQTNNRSGDTTYIFSVFTSILRVAMNNQVQVII